MLMSFTSRAFKLSPLVGRIRVRQNSKRGIQSLRFRPAHIRIERHMNEERASIVSGVDRWMR